MPDAGELSAESVLQQLGIVAEYAVILHLAVHRVYRVKNGGVRTTNRIAYLGERMVGETFGEVDNELARAHYVLLP